MKQFFKIFFACLLAIVSSFLLVFLFFAIMVAATGSKEEVVVKSNSVLTIDLSDMFPEQTKENSFGFLSGDDQQSTGLNDLLASIQQAKTDDKIKGIYVKMNISPNGWATLHELHQALLDFKTSKKFVLSYGEIADQKSVYISTACDQAYIHPQGGAEYKGLAIVGMFFKGTLDKLDIQTEAFHCGQFKGAHEPYSRTNFSEANKAQLQALLNDLNSELLMALSKKSGKDTATISSLMNAGSVRFPMDAVRQGFMDGVVYSDSIESMMKKRLAIKSDAKINYVGVSDYASSITKKTSGDKIAILYAEGGIADGEGNDEGVYSKDMVKEIRKIAKDKSIKGLVLRVNSPGGSALASDVIYHELEVLHRSIPIIVSMGNYAASGGYYIACASDSLIADKNTLTGSIGVVGVLMNVGDFYKNKLGITTDVIKTSNYADFPNLTRPMTDLERGWIQSYLDTTYNRFKGLVAKNRKMTPEAIEALAQGHVYTGTTALQLKLVDALGTKQRAIESAAKMAKLSNYAVVEYPKPVDQFEELLSNLMGKKREEAALKKMLGDDYVMYKEIQKIKNQQNSIQMIMPWKMDIK
jgi:protease-4